MSTREEGLTALFEEVSARGGRIARAADDPRFFTVVSADGTRSRVKVATKAAGTWQVTKSDRLPEKNRGVDFWILVSTRHSLADAVIVDAEWIRNLLDVKTAAWLAADSNRTLDNDHAAIGLSEVAQWQGRWDLLGLGEAGEDSIMSARAVTTDNLGAWVFTCNPDVYDLPAEIDDGETFVDNWSVAQNYRSDMIHAGHRAILWMAGAKSGYAPRGVWGIGWTTGRTFDVNGLGGGYWVDDHQAGQVRLMAPTAITVLDEMDRVPADDIEANPVLARIEKLTAPWQSNPSWISKAQLSELEKLLPEWPAIGDVPTKAITVGQTGAGFGTAEHNRQVELAATRAVQKYLESDWEADVHDVSSDNLGWDLTATTPGGSDWHVEVKGVSGNLPVVLLTRNEWRVARIDPCWELAVVTNALSDHPVVRIYDADQMASAAEPFVFRADMSEMEGWGGDDDQ